MIFVEAAEPDSISGAAGAAISGNTPSQRTPALEASRTGSISVTLSGERGAIAGAAGAAGGGAEGSGRAAQDEWAVRSLLALLVQMYKF